MTCETCRYWDFPTNAIYQNVATKGVCSRRAVKDGTGPNDTCSRHVFEEKSEDHKHAAMLASQAGGMKKLGDALKKPNEMEDLRKAIDNLSIKALDPPSNDAKFGDMLIPHYIKPMQYVAANQDDAGNITELVLKKPDGKLLVIGVNECQFLRHR